MQMKHQKHIENLIGTFIFRRRINSAVPRMLYLKFAVAENGVIVLLYFKYKQDCCEYC